MVHARDWLVRLVRILHRAVLNRLSIAHSGKLNWSELFPSVHWTDDDLWRFRDETDGRRRFLTVKTVVAARCRFNAQQKKMKSTQFNSTERSSWVEFSAWGDACMSRRNHASLCITMELLSPWCVLPVIRKKRSKVRVQRRIRHCIPWAFS